ncbi:uncharacterized protein TRIADDRAFT_57031 [Trichoplax adhaerens]|uniref:Uncharacterized protein n=1 Tax=Trichoplax adhaerens TaxID=10228 RepID=B3S0F6_TRIAD|nr:hypothetical protein TRIADDRAFT_57031 [Trichoplax adhaerens]EDV24005.1 hypothetical protein TRIADDRAFT_57031 [Trichoplax adhaerens]|eukprot:XP_002113531.1 hypothetical protein TRIADDRAFT_57031 [Trichoplax adhaerens]
MRRANPSLLTSEMASFSFSEEKNEALTDDFFRDESDIGNIFAEFGINRDNTADDLSFLSTEKTANSKGSTIKVKEEASKTKVDSSTSKPSPHPNSIPANISNSVSLSEIAHYNAGIQPTNYDTEIQRTRQTSTSSQEINTIAAENINKADNNIIAKNLNANSEKPGKNTYIENNIEPEDYQISFANNSLYQKFERKVNNLSGSQEKVLEEAINNRDLFIIVDDVKRYPDNYRYQKTQRAYYVSFTLNIDAKQAQQIQYYEVKSAGKDDLQAYGKSVEKFEAKVRGLWSNVPTSSIELYMKKLINENVTLRYLVVGNSKKIEISNATVSDNIVRVYGYNLSEESSSSLSQLSVSSLHNEGCRNMSNPENAYERWVGRIIGIPDNINLETWFATHRDSVYLKASINGVLLAPDHLEMSSSHPIVVYHAPIEEERLKSSIQSPADQAPNRADTDANGELPVLSSSSSTSSITSASSTTIKSQGKRISATVKKIKTAIGKTDKVTRNRSSSAVTGAVTTQAVDNAPPNDKLIKQPVVLAVTVSKEDMLTKEIRRLREQLLRLKWEKNNIPPVKETIKKIVLGQPYFLDGYKDMNDKLALLKEAIRSDDGNAILILKDHPVATDQYLHYLKVASEHKDLIDMYSVLGRTQEFAALKYKLALVGGDPQVKIQNLEELKKEFKYDRQLSVFSAIVSQQCSLIKRQISIEAQDSVLISGESNEMLVKYPPTGSIFEHSLIKTLNYCAKYHSSLPQDHFSSPHSVHKENKLTERQFIMATVDAYVKTDQLQYIENFNKTKSKFFNFGSKSSTPNETILQALVSAKASEETATKYLKNIENVTARYDLAKRFRYHTIAVECLISLRNRDELEEYCTKIKRNSPAYSVAAQALVNPNSLARLYKY